MGPPRERDGEMQSDVLVLGSAGSFNGAAA